MFCYRLGWSSSGAVVASAGLHIILRLRDRETERQRDRETERQRDRETPTHLEAAGVRWVAVERGVQS